MERAHPRKIHIAVEQFLDTRFHFARSLVRKRHRQNAVCLDTVFRHKMSNLIGNATSLSRTGTRQDKHRAINLFSGSRLLRIQFSF